MNMNGLKIECRVSNKRIVERPELKGYLGEGAFKGILVLIIQYDLFCFSRKIPVKSS